MESSERNRANDQARARIVEAEATVVERIREILGR
jgi:hypothetical protein